jgi:hypothetical protein
MDFECNEFGKLVVESSNEKSMRKRKGICECEMKRRDTLNDNII